MHQQHIAARLVRIKAQKVKHGIFVAPQQLSTLATLSNVCGGRSNLLPQLRRKLRRTHYQQLSTAGGHQQLAHVIGSISRNRLHLHVIGNDVIGNDEVSMHCHHIPRFHDDFTAIYAPTATTLKTCTAAPIKRCAPNAYTKAKPQYTCGT